jgi:hypothetical protein
MQQPMMVPEWVCTLVGRLVLDNEALRRELGEAASQEETPPIEVTE